MNAMTDIPAEIGHTIIACIIYFAATSVLINNLMNAFAKKSRREETDHVALSTIFPYAVAFAMPLLTSLRALQRTGGSQHRSRGLMVIGVCEFDHDGSPLSGTGRAQSG